LLFVATYQWNGLRIEDEAIETLAAAENRGALAEDGRWQLVVWLVEKKRFGEALPLSAKLVAERPDTLHYSTMNITVLHWLGRDADALALLDATEKRFREHDVWNENTIATLASTCLQCEFFERSVAYYEEAIPLHQRTRPNRGVGGGTLSSYYGQMARAYIGLGQVDPAVDAASAAVVSWGASHSNRQGAIQSLRSVLDGIEDLDGFVSRRDKEVAASGLDAPLIRKLLGQVYLSRRQAQRAIVQLSLAAQLQSVDPETYVSLVQAYDMRGDDEGACRVLVEAIDGSPQQLDLYSDLARRLARRGQRDEAERAWTGVVEALPEEAESHRALAQHRESEGRHAEAIVQWRQVVRVRTDEPEGWLALARAQIQLRRFGPARETLDHVLKTEWDRRFGDVQRQAGRLLDNIPVQPPR
jgi:tetratricopeptide (TPR) repeat protein